MGFIQPKIDTDENDVAFRVPSEIWVKIMSHMNQKELVRARTVCSTWRNVVDEHFGFSVIVHDDKTDLERVYKLRIKDCLITKLLDNEDILQYPDLLRRVRFWGPINILNIQRIMSQATKLEELSMTRCALTQENLFDKENLLLLENLIKLELLGYCCKDAGDAVSNNSIRLFSQKMPVLRKIFVNITCYWKQMDPIVTCFFEFLARHRKKITHVNTSLIPASGGHENISHLSTPIPQNIKDLVYDKELQLESLRLTLASKYISCWAPIISSQKKLSDIRVHWSTSSEPPHPNLTGISAAILYPAIIQSAANLVQVDLRDLNLTFDDRRVVIPFDASIFRCAQNLRRLTLVRNKDDCQRLTEPYGASTIINLDAIAPTLEDFEIVRFKCNSAELQTLIDSSVSLKIIKLQHLGTSNGNGVHGGIVESITRKDGIKIMNICPINYYDPEENKKLEALKPIYEGICSGSDHIYYDFDRFRQGKPQPSKRASLPSIPQESTVSTSSTHCRFQQFERRTSHSAIHNLRIRSRLARSEMQGSSRDSPPSGSSRSRMGPFRWGSPTCLRRNVRSRSISGERLYRRHVVIGEPISTNNRNLALPHYQNRRQREGRRCSSADDLIDRE